MIVAPESGRSPSHAEVQPDESVEGRASGGGLKGEADLSEMPLEVLERQLTTWAARIAAAEAAWLAWLGEYDTRQGWAEWGCINAAQWLSWNCGMGAVAARERVRVARALRDLPLLAAEFEAGRLSYSKVRALTRVANVDNEPGLVAVALTATGAQCERICQALRRVERDANLEAAEAFASRTVLFRRNYDGTSTISLRLTDDAASLVRAHIDHVARAMIDEAVAVGTAWPDESGQVGAVDGAGAVESGGRGSATDTVAAVSEDRVTVSRREMIEQRHGHGAVRADAAVALLTNRWSPGQVESAAQAMERTRGGEQVDAGDPQARESVPVLSADVAIVVDGDSHDSHSLDSDPHTSPDPAPNPDATAEPSPTDHNGGVSAGTGGAVVSGSGEGVSAGTGGARPRSTSSSNGLQYELDGRAVPDTVGERLCCDPRVRALVESARTGTIDASRASRVVSRRLRRALERRDRYQCQFPGCFCTSGLHAHHIIHWARGGPTVLNNLVLLCPFHHHLVHEGGWDIDPESRAFIRPDHGPVPPDPELVRYRSDRGEPLGELEWIDADPTQLQPEYHDRLELGWTIGVIVDNETLRRTRRLDNKHGR